MNSSPQQLPTGMQKPLDWAEDPRAVPLVEGAPESRPHEARCAVVTGSLPVSAAEALLAQWDHLANFHAASRRSKDHYGRGYSAGLADAYTIAATQLRQQMAATSERQPEENEKAQTRAD
jgi:hypothetical protein